MFLLITGASGAGKSTVRELIAADLPPAVESVELHDVVEPERFPTLTWRQRSTEAAVRRALALQAEGRHLLLAGDPVAAAELIAAPSAGELDAIAVCLLDLNRDAQTARLSARGDDPSLFVHHIAFADWMRAHARDAGHMPQVLQTGGWDQMRWDRLRERDGWAMRVLDTSALSAPAVAREVLTWCIDALAGRAPVMRPPS
jgi:energy-coupling factor transporter ATP-binding protein EcfA2